MAQIKQITIFILTEAIINIIPNLLAKHNERYQEIG